MRIILQKPYRLRGWKGHPFFLEQFPDRTLRELKPEEFVYLLRCDGRTEINPGDWPPEPAWVAEKNITVPCLEEETLLPEQEYKCYPNRCFPYMELSVTGRCNLRCRHCFNAAGTEARTVEPDFDGIKKLLSEMAECGVGRLRLVGGEPLVRKEFLEITAEMSRLGIRLYEILTNGWFITPELLDVLESQGHGPIWFISFDGLGLHDWLRGSRRAEPLILDKLLAIREKYHLTENRN